MSIKDIFEEERPREKLKLDGAQSLSDSELLAIIIRSGNKQMNALELSRSILTKTNGIRMLSTYSLEKLLEIDGIALAKASSILACFELSKRSYSKVPVNYIIETSLDTFTIMNSLLSNKKEEYLYALFLDTSCKLISKSLISVGSVNSTNFNKKSILKKALMANASGIILVHNHPSGNITPSKNDIELTENFKKSAAEVNLFLFDHIIIGAGKYYSFLDNSRF